MISDPRGIWIKIDGVTREEDIRAAADAGVSAVGMILAPSSREVTLERALELRGSYPAGLPAFGVFDGDPGEVVATLRLDGVQLPAAAPLSVPARIVLRTVRVRGPEDLEGLEVLDCDAVHLDAYVEGKMGGTGTLAPWDVIEANRPAVPFVLSGGLRPENVAEAVRRLRPAGVDVSSGVELSPGLKDPDALRGFVRAAREAGV